MGFKELLHRANLNALESYLMHGDMDYGIPNEKTYSERLGEARKKAMAFFEARYSDLDEYDEISGCYSAQTDVYRDVYFEIGLLVGAKIAFQIRGKIEELK